MFDYEKEMPLRYSDEKEAFIREVRDAVQHHLHVVLQNETVDKFIHVVENDVFLQAMQKASEQAITDAANTTNDGQRAVLCGQARAYISVVQMLQQLKRIAMGK